MSAESVTQFLHSNMDENFRAFTARIVNADSPVLGVRTPILKMFAKTIAADADAYFESATFETYEHILLYGLVIGAAKRSCEETLSRLDFLIPKMNSWAHVDQTLSACKVLKKNPAENLAHFMPLISGGAFERRFLVIYLMDYCLTDRMLETCFDVFEQAQCSYYYVNMAIAWALSVAAVRDFDRTATALASGRFSPWVVKKAVQKSRESRRLTAEQKAFLTLSCADAPSMSEVKK